MTTEHQREQADRREFLENEKRLREQGTTEHKSTYASFAEAFADEERGGRFKQTPQHIVGSAPIPQYPAAFQQRDPVPKEEPLNYDINAMEPVGTAAEVQASLERLRTDNDERIEGEKTE